MNYDAVHLARGHLTHYVIAVELGAQVAHVTQAASMGGTFRPYYTMNKARTDYGAIPSERPLYTFSTAQAALNVPLSKPPLGKGKSEREREVPCSFLIGHLF